MMPAGASGSLVRGSFDKESKVAGEAPASKYPVSCWTMIVYSQIKLMMSLYDFTLRPARFTTYIEGLGMPTSTQATLVSVCQCFSLLLGVVVGKWSDSVRTKWGRRKPFLCVAMPLGTLCFVMFCTPTLTFFRPADNLQQAPCADQINLDRANNTCPDLRTCLIDAFNITADFPSGTRPVLPDLPAVPPNLLAMGAFFTVFYAGYYSQIWNAVSIPYDALGMELTDDSERRVVMFAVRAFLQVIGYMIPSIVMIFLDQQFSEDVPKQYAYMSMIFGVCGLVGTVMILAGVSERPPKEEKEEEAIKVPVVPSIRRLLANRAYRKYLSIRLPFTIVSLLPSNMALFYIKFVLAREEYVTLNATASIMGILGFMIAIYPALKLAQKIGRGMVLFFVSFLMVAAFATVFFLSGAYVNENVELILFSVNFLIGTSWAAFFMLMDGLLGDCIDYDELLTGERNEAMYTVVETQMSLSIEILGGVLPLTLLQILSYENNGGCTCGCGTPCGSLGAPYARWICPGDVAFTCDGRIASDLMFGDMGRLAPCTAQSELVQTGIKFFYVGLPALCGLLAMLPAYMWPISTKMNEEIMREVQLRNEDENYVCTDPLTGEKVKLPENSEVGFFREHFSAWERGMAAGAANVVDRLKSLVQYQMAMYIIVLLVAIATMVLLDNDAIRTICILSFTVMIAMIVWTVLRLRALNSPPSGVEAIEMSSPLVS